jgi:hypothetical protein
MMYFVMFAEGPSSFEHARVEHVQVGLQEDHVGGLFRNVDGRIHR